MLIYSLIAHYSKSSSVESDLIAHAKNIYRDFMRKGRKLKNPLLFDSSSFKDMNLVLFGSVPQFAPHNSYCHKNGCITSEQLKNPLLFDSSSFKDLKLVLFGSVPSYATILTVIKMGALPANRIHIF